MTRQALLRLAYRNRRESGLKRLNEMEPRDRFSEWSKPQYDPAHETDPVAYALAVSAFIAKWVTP